MPKINANPYRIFEQKVKALPFALLSTQSSCENRSLPAVELNIRKMSGTSGLAFDRRRS
jgi:hypothetical protein